MTPEESIAWNPSHPGGSTDILPFFRDVLLPRIPHGGTYLEVGVFFGRSLAFVGKERPDLRLIACDQWLDEWEDAGEKLPVGPDRERRDLYGGMYNAFRVIMMEHAPEVMTGAKRPGGAVRILRGNSAQKLGELPDASVDAAFLDGDHTHVGLLADIHHAKRIVKPGGIIAGHDFHDPKWGSDVTRAVRDEFLFKVGAKGYELAPWPVDREGWSPGYSSCWYVKRWSNP